jgi:hypothetical protein
MKKFSFLIVAGFLSVSALAENGKWFDYGNGIINLNTVNMITPKGGSIKFDNFSLTIYQIDYKRLIDLEQGLDDKDKQALEKVKDDAEDILEEAKSATNDVMDKIRDFLDDDDTYLKL